MSDFTHSQRRATGMVPASFPARPRLTSESAARPTPGYGRLVAWLVVVGLLVLLAFASTLSETQEPRDLLFRYSTAVLIVIQWAVLAVPVLLILRGSRTREILALRRPKRWRWALGAGLAILIGSYAFTVLYDSIAGTDEAEFPLFWDSSRTGQLVANVLMIVVFVPVVEELMFRGLGYGLLERFGAPVAIVGTGVLFGLVHGYLVALPVFIGAGLALGWLRSRTGSVYPGMLVHAAMNALAVIVIVATSAAAPACRPPIEWVLDPTGETTRVVPWPSESQENCNPG